MFGKRFILALTFIALATIPADAVAQSRKVRIVSSDSQPIVYAYVTADGGTGQITDQNGEVSFGAGKAKTLTVNVRRIGYQPWFGKLALPDTAATLTVTLPRVAQALGEIRVSGNSTATLSVPMKGFYERWMMRQQGLLSAVFIGPEEIEFRHPNKITNMLYGLNGVTLVRNNNGDVAAMGYNGQCPMAIVLDGVRQCPAAGCHTGGEMNATDIMQGMRKPVINDQSAVIIDHLIDAASVSAIEVYARGANMPVSLQVSDPACGVIAIWTGSRRP
jgi:hypothetical protein